MQSYHNPPYPGSLVKAALPRGRTVVLAPTARLALGGILLLALALRLWGLNFGLPYIIQPDEPSVQNRALHMWYAGDPNPHYFVYPSLYYDLQALLALVVGHVAGLFQPDIAAHPTLHLPLFYLAGRSLTVALSMLTILAVYLTGRMLSLRIGLIAALFLAVSPQHIQQSHYITVDAPTALFTALAALFALHMLRDGARWSDVALAGAAAGLAAGTKYNAAVALVMPLGAALIVDRPWAWRLRTCAVAACVCALTFLLTTPYALLDPAPFLNSLQVVSHHYATGHPGAEGNDNAIWYLQYLASDGMLLPVTALALAGIIVALVRFRRLGLVLLAFSLAYYALLSSTYVRFDRNLLPLLPFVALFAAMAADSLIPRLVAALRNRGAASLLVLGVSTIPPIYVAGRADFAITHPFSEQVAVAWADAHLPAGASLAIENWEGRAFELSPRHYRITELSSLAAQAYGWYLARGIRYVAADSYTDGAYLRAPHLYPLQVARYRELYRRARRLWCVTGDPLLRPGPDMCLYEVRP